MFWNRKKHQNKNQKNNQTKNNPEITKKSDYFLEIGLTNQQNVSISIGWPHDQPEEEIIHNMIFLINGTISGLLSDEIISTLKDIDNPIIKTILTRLPMANITNYINPMDVL